MSGRERDESGTALVEFVWLAILLIVPLLYIVLAAFDTQRAAYAASSAARSAGRAFVTAPDQATGYARADAAVRLAYRDQRIETVPDVSDQLSARPAQLPDAGVGGARRDPLVGRPAADACRARLEHPEHPGRLRARGAVRHLPRGPAMRPRDERGSVTPLIIGFAVVVALLVAVVVDASAAYLRRQGLNSAADAAALAATDGIQGEEVYTHGLGKRAEIDPAAARAYVADYFASSGIRRRFPGLDYSVQTTENTVVVRVVTPMDLPFRVPGVGTNVPITGTAASVVVVSD